MTRSRRSAPAHDTRTSADDRDVVVGLLNDAYSHGRLEPGEYQARLDKAMRTGTYAELYRVLDGLPIDRGRLPRPPTPQRPRWVLPTAVGGVVVAAGAGVALLVTSAGDEPAVAGSVTPTESPASPTPTPEPTPTDPRPDNDTTVAAATQSGTGTTIVTVPWADGVTPMIEFEVDKPRWSTFSLADADGAPFFVYVDGGAGARVVGATVMPDYAVSDGDQLRVKVETEGTWTLTLSDVDDAPTLGASGSGTGYRVGWYDGPEGVFSMSADDGNFAVWDDWRLIVNGIGPERDEGIIDAGRRLLRIEADALWRYEIR